MKSLFKHVNFMFLQAKICVSVRVCKSFAQCCFSVLMKDRSLSKKMIPPVIFDTDHSFKQQNALCLTKKSFMKVSMVRRSRYFFTSRKSSVFDMRQQDLRDNFLLGRLCWKNYISGYIWHKSFIQTVKCSFFNQIIVYQSFCGTLLSYFLLRRKFLCIGSRVGKSVTCERFII